MNTHTLFTAKGFATKADALEAATFREEYFGTVHTVVYNPARQIHKWVVVDTKTAKDTSK